MRFSEGTAEPGWASRIGACMRCEELPDRLQDPLIDCLLGFMRRFELSFGNQQRMISTFDEMQLIPGCHLATHFSEQIERAKRIARSLHEEDRCPQFAQDFVSQLRGITSAAQRIAEANDRRHVSFECEMTTDSRTHALADQDRRPTLRPACVVKRCAMRPQKYRHRIRTPSAFRHVRVVERVNQPESAK